VFPGVSNVVFDELRLVTVGLVDFKRLQPWWLQAENGLPHLFPVSPTIGPALDNKNHLLDRYAVYPKLSSDGCPST